MANLDWSSYAVSGAARPDSFTGMNGKFQEALSRMFEAAPQSVRDNLRVSSGYRSPERQRELFAAAVKKYGSEQAARKWVAKQSFHTRGFAADLKFLNPEARKWVHANAAKFGLNFPLRHENWHIELNGVRSGKFPKGALSLSGLADRRANTPVLPNEGPIPEFRPSPNRPDNSAAGGPRGAFSVPGDSFHPAPLGQVTRAPLAPISKPSPTRPDNSDYRGPQGSFAVSKPNPMAAVQAGSRAVSSVSSIPRPSPMVAPATRAVSSVSSATNLPRPMTTPAAQAVSSVSSIANLPKAPPPNGVAAGLSAIKAVSTIPTLAPQPAKPAPRPAPRPLTRTVMPTVAAAPPVPAPRPTQTALGQRPTTIGYGTKAIEAIRGGAGYAGDVAYSRSDPNVSYTALGNGMVAMHNAKYGTVSYSYAGSPKALGGTKAATAGKALGTGGTSIGNASQRGGNSGNSGGGGSQVSGGTRTSGGGYGASGMDARGSDFSKHDK